jgi:hypothetical protein
MKIIVVNDDGSVLAEYPIPTIPAITRGRVIDRRQAKKIVSDIVKDTPDGGEISLSDQTVRDQFVNAGLALQTISSAFDHFMKKTKTIERASRGVYRKISKPRIIQSA